MKKRKFISLMAAGSLGLMASPSALLGGAGSKASDLPQKNWVWLRPDPEIPDEVWRKKCKAMKKAGVHAVLPQVYNSHFALFHHPNPLVPVKSKFLERFIPIAHSCGLEVHAWMWTMPCNIPAVIRKHPDWYAVNRNGEPSHEKPAYVDYYKFLSPNHFEAIGFIKSTVKALGQIRELDGIHLDYVRLPDVILAKSLQQKYDIVQDKEYPQYDYCYSNYSRTKFKVESGVDPLDLEDPATHEGWRKFRYNSITKLVNYHLAPAARTAGKTISAAVFPNWEHVRQAWHDWEIDCFLPMLYHNFYDADLAWIKRETAKGLARLNHKKPVYSGLYIPSLSPDELEEAIRFAFKGGSRGVALFNMDAMEDAHWKVLKKS